MRSSAANPTCVSGMAALTWDLADEIAMYGRVGVELVGLPAAKVRGMSGEALGALLARNAVRVGYLVHPLTAQPDDEGAWSAQRDSLRAAIDDAGSLGAELVYVTSGPSGELEWERAADVFAERFAPSVSYARSQGVRLAIENTMSVRCDLSFTHSLRDALALAERVDAGVCLDLYCCWQERGLGELVDAQLARIDLVQVSDFVIGTSTFPNRWVPGDGQLPIDRLLDRVLAAGYRGIVDAELIGPAIDTEGAESALRRAVAWMRSRIAAV